MHILLYISDFIVPFIVLSIVVYGLLSGINVYESFIKGAKSGFLTVLRIMPTLIGLMAAVGILRASGFLDFLSALITMCCTETIFYTMSVYFMTAGVKRSRYTLAGALIATFAGLAASVFLAQSLMP